MASGRYVKPKPGEKTGTYLPCPRCGKPRCECLELKFLAVMEADGLPKPPEREYRFCGVRAWRADFAYPARFILVEIEGGGGVGRHTSVAGFRQDCIKYNAATALGWKVYRFDGRMLTLGIAAKTMRAALLGGDLYIPTTTEGSPKRRKSPPKPPKHSENAQKRTETPKKARKSLSPNPTKKPEPPTIDETDPVRVAIVAAKKITRRSPAAKGPRS